MSTDFSRRWVSSVAPITTEAGIQYCQYCNLVQPAEKARIGSLHYGHCSVLDAYYLSLNGASDFSQFIVNKDSKKFTKIKIHPNLKWLDLVEDYLHGNIRTDQIFIGNGVFHTVIIKDRLMKDIYTSTIEEFENLLYLFQDRVPSNIGIVVRDEDGLETELNGFNDSSSGWEVAVENYALYIKNERQMLKKVFNISNDPVHFRSLEGIKSYPDLHARIKSLLYFRLSVMAPGYYKVDQNNQISVLHKALFDELARIQDEGRYSQNRYDLYQVDKEGKVRKAKLIFPEVGIDY